MSRSKARRCPGIEVLENRCVLSGDNSVLFTHFTTGMAKWSGETDRLNMTDTIELVAPRGDLAVTMSTDRADWTPGLTVYDARGQPLPIERSAGQSMARVRIPGDNGGTWPRTLYLNSASEVRGLRSYRVGVSAESGATSKAGQFVQDTLDSIERNYADMGYNSPPDLVSTLDRHGFDGGYEWIETERVTLGMAHDVGNSRSVTPSGWVYAIDVSAAHSFQTLRVTVTPEADSAGDIVVYLATKSQRSASFDRAGYAGAEVAEIAIDSARDRVYVLIEESEARFAHFRIRIEAEAKSALPSASGADAFIDRLRAQGWTAEYTPSMLRAAFVLHDAVPWQRVYARSDWGGENYWFQSSNGDVWSLWHGGAVHARPNGSHQWTLTNLTDAAGLASGIASGSLSGTFTSWRAFNVVGVDSAGALVTYWWSPESYVLGWGARKNGWVLSDLSSAASWGSQPRTTLWGATTTQRAMNDGHSVERLEIIASSKTDTSRQFVFWFDANRPGIGWQVASA